MRVEHRDPTSGDRGALIVKVRVALVCGFVAGLFVWAPPLAVEAADIESLTKQAQEGSIFERIIAIRALSRSGDPRAFDPLVDLLRAADSEDIQARAAYALGNLRDTRAIPVLIDVLAFTEDRYDGTVSKGEVAARALRKYEEVAVLPLCEALSNPNPKVRREAGKILGWLEDPRSIGPLIDAMADSSLDRERYVQYTYERFKRFGQPAIDALVEAIEDERPRVCIGAARSLASAYYREALVQRPVGYGQLPHRYCRRLAEQFLRSGGLEGRGRALFKVRNCKYQSRHEGQTRSPLGGVGKGCVRRR